MKRASEKTKHILGKASQLFRANGFNHTTMRDLALACNFDVSNFYNYFKSKEQILYAMVVDQTNNLVNLANQVENDSTKSPKEQLYLCIKHQLDASLPLIEGHISIFFEHEMHNLTPSHRRKVIQLRDQYEDILCRIIERGIKVGSFRRLDAKIATKCIVSVIARTRLWYSPKGRLSIGDMADFIFDLILRGMGKDVCR